MSENVQLSHVTMDFGGFRAVDDVDLTIGAGEFFSFLGPSGCGKTTLLRMISGFIEPTAGEVRIGGQPMRGIGPNKRPTALIFQNLALFPLMSVAENIAFGLEVRGVPKDKRRARAEDLLRTVDLAGSADKRISQLSGGQKQRVAIARALAVEPKVMLLDEPLSALDLKLRQHMRSELRAIQKRTDVTFVYITHDQGEALAMSDRVAVMSAGILQQVGTPAEIYNRPSNLFVADFMGSPAMNLLKAKVVAENGSMVLKLTQTGQQDVSFAAPASIAMAPLEAGRDLILGIRPEAITDRDGADRNSKAVQFVDGLVDVVEPAGSDTFVVTQLGGKALTARMRSDAEVKAGQTVPFAFNLDKAVLFDPASGVRL